MKSEQRLNIIELAGRMFATEGIKSVRMDDIANRAGISKRTLYEEFTDKEQLVELAVRDYFTKLDQSNHEIASSAPNILVAFIETTLFMLDHADTTWRLRNTLKRFNRAMHDRIFNRTHAMQAAFVKELNKGVEEGLFTPHANMALAVSMLYNIGSTIANEDQQFELPEGITPKWAFFELSVNFMRGLATQKGLAIIDQYLEEKYNKNIK